MKRTAATLTAITAVAISLTVVSIVFARSANMPSCSARVGEICITKTGDGPVLEGVERSSQIEMERYAFSFRSASGSAYELIVIRDDSLNEIKAHPARGASTSRIETRMWNGAKASAYAIRGSVPGVSVKICVESWLWPQCSGSGTLTRLTAYRG